MARPSLDEYFMEIAEVVSKRSTCHRRKIGAVLVRDKHILTTGYNGAPSGCKDCLELGCLRNELKIPSGERIEICRAVHAELNAIIQAALHGIVCEGATMYVTVQPCVTCAKAIVNARIKKVVYKETYPDNRGIEFLKEANIEVKRFNNITK